MTPNVTITKTDGNTGVSSPSDIGIAMVVAPGSSGTENLPTPISSGGQAESTFGDGALTETCDYIIRASGKPVVAVRAGGSTPGAYGTLTNAGKGTSTPVAGGTTPQDDYNVLVSFTVGGVLGTAGIEYTYSLDGGDDVSSQQALGSSLILTIPNSGVSFTMGTSTQTVLAGQTISVTTTGPRDTTGDLSDAFTAIAHSAITYEGIILESIDATSAVVGQLDSFLQSLEAVGKYKFGIVNARPKGFGIPGETEAQYLAALTTLFSGISSERVLVGADGANVTSLLTGETLFRGTGVFVMGRAMAQQVSVDPAEVDLGALPNCQIKDVRGNPLYHDEMMDPGLDGIKLTVLRSIPGEVGTYVNNANILSPNGSDYVYLQQLRVMNRACEIVFSALTFRLSKRVRKNLTPDPTTGAVYIYEGDAQKIDAYVLQQLNAQLGDQVTQLGFRVSRTDDLGSNGPGTISATLQVNGFEYVKQFNVLAGFVRSVTL